MAASRQPSAYCRSFKLIVKFVSSGCCLLLGLEKRGVAAIAGILNADSKFDSVSKTI